MARLLGALEHRVTTASGVGTALAAAEGGEFDLLISDIGLGDGSGMDLMRELLKPLADQGHRPDRLRHRVRRGGHPGRGLRRPPDQAGHFDRLEALILEVGAG